MSNIDIASFTFEPSREKNQQCSFPNRYDTNQAVQSLKLARDWKF